MKQLVLSIFCSFLMLTSCSKDEIQVIGVEITGTSTLNGSYMLDKTYDKGTKYVNLSNNSQYLKTAFIDNKDMWILMRGNVYYYKIEQNGAYPPKSGWECGFDVDKDKFKCELILD